MSNHPIIRRLAVLVLLISAAVLSHDITAEHYQHACRANQSRPITAPAR